MIPCKETLKNAEDELRKKYDNYLKKHDVVWPNGQELTGLVYLFLRKGEIVSKDELTKVVREYHPGAGDYQSGRHLTDKGWDVRSTNKRFSRGTIISEADNPNKKQGYMLGSVENPNPNWMTKAKIKRKGAINADTWQELLIMFRERGCAVCGEHADHYDKGHLDSSKPPQMGNIVPMCSECNQWGQARCFNYKLKGLVARPYK